MHFAPRNISTFVVSATFTAPSPEVAVEIRNKLHGISYSSVVQCTTTEFEFLCKVTLAMLQSATPFINFVSRKIAEAN